MRCHLIQVKMAKKEKIKDTGEEVVNSYILLV
jgi:hypothetical protein